MNDPRNQDSVIEFAAVTSAANPRVKEARALLRGRKPGKAGSLFAGEGMQLATRALTGGADVEYLLMSQDVADFLPVDFAAAVGARGVQVLVAPGALFQKVSRRSMPSGVVFVAREPRSGFGDLPEDVPVLVLDRASNPRNIGAIARTCEAAGLGGLVLAGHHADPFGYESVRASMGSVFGVPIVGCTDDELIEWVRSSGRVLIGTSGAAEQSLWQAELPASSAIMFGNEGEGLSEHLLSACDELLKIPYNQAVDSLNLGAAVAVVAFEYRRRNPF